MPEQSAARDAAARSAQALRSLRATAGRRAVLGPAHQRIAMLVLFYLQRTRVPIGGTAAKIRADELERYVLDVLAGERRQAATEWRQAATEWRQTAGFDRPTVRTWATDAVPPELVENIETWDRLTREAEAAAQGIVEAGKPWREQLDAAMAELRETLNRAA